jgi:hypothetical protein
MRQGRPLPGNSLHELAGKSGAWFHRCRRVCDDLLPATWLKTRSCVFEAMRSRSVRCGFLPGPGRRLPLVGPGPGDGTRREEHVLPIDSDEFRPATPGSGCTPAGPVSASPAGQDYHAPFNHPGTRGHFYFALTYLPETWPRSASRKLGCDKISEPFGHRGVFRCVL